MSYLEKSNDRACGDGYVPAVVYTRGHKTHCQYESMTSSSNDTPHARSKTASTMPSPRHSVRWLNTELTARNVHSRLAGVCCHGRTACYLHATGLAWCVTAATRQTPGTTHAPWHERRGGLTLNSGRLHWWPAVLANGPRASARTCTSRRRLYPIVLTMGGVGKNQWQRELTSSFSTEFNIIITVKPSYPAPGHLYDATTPLISTIRCNRNLWTRQSGHAKTA